MANINDAKPKKPFIPTLQQGNTVINTPTKKNQRPLSPGVSQGPSSNAIYPPGTIKGMIMRSADSSERETVDIGSIAPSTDTELESYGIKKSESVAKDILEGENSPFAQYKKEKTAEMMEWMADMEQKTEEKLIEQEQQNNGDPADSEEDDNIDNTKETVIVRADSYRSIDITKTPNKEEDEMHKNSEYDNFDEDEKEDFIDEEDEYDEDEENDPPLDVDTEEDNESDSEDYEEDEYDEDEENDPPLDADDEEDAVQPNAVASEVENNLVEAAINIPGVEVIDVKEEVVPAKIGKKPAKSNMEKRIDRISRTVLDIPVDEDEEDDDYASSKAAQETNKEEEELLKAQIHAKIKPVSKALDFSSFTVVEKGDTSNSILASSSAAVAKWPLPATGIVVAMREISGANLEKLRSAFDRNPADNIGGLRIIYDHIVSPKPKSFEAWTKSIAYEDFPHLFMGVYVASFAEANYIPADCTNPSCGKPFLSDQMPIMSMVKFPNKDMEKQFWDLYNDEPVESKGLYTTEMIAISDDYAITLKMPSLYDALIETGYYNDSFREQYEQTLNYAPYISNLYRIDKDNRRLIKIDYKRYDNNQAKNTRSKIRRFAQVLNTLTPDQHSLLMVCIRKIDERIDMMTYQMPELTCPYCGITRSAVDQTSFGLVFLRNRLALLANS